MFRVSSVADVESILAEYQTHRIIDSNLGMEISPADDADELASLASRCG
jgi:hypothetical protein